MDDVEGMNIERTTGDGGNRSDDSDTLWAQVDEIEEGIEEGDDRPSYLRKRVLTIVGSDFNRILC